MALESEPGAHQVALPSGADPIQAPARPVPSSARRGTRFTGTKSHLEKGRDVGSGFHGDTVVLPAALRGLPQTGPGSHVSPGTWLGPGPPCGAGRAGEEAGGEVPNAEIAVASLSFGARVKYFLSCVLL